MITKFERLISLLVCLSSEEAASVQQLLVDIRTGGEPTMAAIGFECVNASLGATMTPDGREISWSGNKAWVLPRDVHDSRLSVAFAQANNKRDDIADTRTTTTHHLTSQTTCPALIDGQLCGGTLNRAAVCPRCALGKSGVTATLTCDVCGHVTAIMRGGS